MSFWSYCWFGIRLDFLEHSVSQTIITNRNSYNQWKPMKSNLVDSLVCLVKFWFVQFIGGQLFTCAQVKMPNRSRESRYAQLNSAHFTTPNSFTRLPQQNFAICSKIDLCWSKCLDSRWLHLGEEEEKRKPLSGRIVGRWKFPSAWTILACSLSFNLKSWTK